MIKSHDRVSRRVTREDERATDRRDDPRASTIGYLDLQLRMPQSLGGDRGATCARSCSKRVARGRVELSVSLQLRQTPGVEVEFNEEFGRALEAALDQARERGLVAGALTPGDLLRLPQALTIRERPADADEAVAGGDWRRRRARRVEQALADLDAMRVARGRSPARRSRSAARARRRPGRAHRRGGRRRARGDGAAAGRARARAAHRAAGRRGRRRAGDRAHGGAVRHQRGGRRASAATSRTGTRSPTAPSRAAASSTSCCRR